MSDQRLTFEMSKLETKAEKCTIKMNRIQLKSIIYKH